MDDKKYVLLVQNYGGGGEGICPALFLKKNRIYETKEIYQILIIQIRNPKHW
jgi:hypothetical protein